MVFGDPCVECAAADAECFCDLRLSEVGLKKEALSLLLFHFVWFYPQPQKGSFSCSAITPAVNYSF